MSWTGSGFIPIIIYPTIAVGSGIADDYAILTENYSHLLTQTGLDIEIEH